MSVCLYIHVCVCPQKSAEGAKSPGPGAISGCKSLVVMRSELRSLSLWGKHFSEHLPRPCFPMVFYCNKTHKGENRNIQ